jgi:YHS domain-containing protein
MVSDRPPSPVSGAFSHLAVANAAELQHIVLHTPIAAWLQVRLRLMAAGAILPSQSFEEMRGAIMVVDPVCGMEVEEINVPESLQAECDGKMYYFCSPECRLEFEQNRRRFVRAA